jgi:hypothetical protein
MACTHPARTAIGHSTQRMPNDCVSTTAVGMPRVGGHHDPGSGSHHNTWEQATLTSPSEQAQLSAPASDPSNLAESQAATLDPEFCADNDNTDPTPAGAGHPCGQEDYPDGTP